MVHQIQEYARGAYNAATSKTAQRTLLNTILVAASSTILFCMAAIAYLVFYHNYLPDQVTTIPIHLQYGCVPFFRGTNSTDGGRMTRRSAQALTV